ncbi:hypothetical protein R1flu_010364 [Riccia fluitans]|uniref:Uncharacterized protein n=1 Tax=Riccia fluitans TaxID=41844 RepID=A0ABD1Z4S2_9MARC
MELHTRFVHYPGPRPDGLHLTHFWFLEHYGLLPYFLQMQAEGIPTKVFFSIVSTCHYVAVVERTEHLELRGLTGQRLVVIPEIVREAFGIPRDAPRDEEQGATWPNRVALSRPRYSSSQERDEPRHRPRLRHERPKRRRARPELPGPLRSLTWRPCLPQSGKSRNYKQQLPGAATKEGAPVEEPPQQAEGRQEDTAIPGFEPSDDKLPTGTLRREISRLRRLQMGTGRQAFSGYRERQKAIEEIPLPPSDQKKKGKKILAVQSGGNPSAQPPPGAPPPATGVPTAGALQPIPVERTLLDRLAEISRPEVMSGTAEEDQAVRDVIPQVPRLTIHAPATDRIDELQVLCAAVPSWARELKQEVAEDRRTRSVLTEWENGAQAERDLARQKYELSVSSHPTLAELMEVMDARVQFAKTDTAHAQEHALRIMDEWRISNQTWRMSLDNMQAQVDKQRDDLSALRTKHHLLTTPEEPTARDLVKCLVLQNSITDIRAEQAKKKVQERDEGLRHAQDDLHQAKEELVKARTDWEKQARASKEELYKVRNAVVQREEETGHWIRNEEKMVEFVREVATLRKELLAKDAKVRELQKTLQERPEETQPEQLESAWKEFHDVEERFALVESPDPSDTSLPSFSPVLVETLRKTLDAEFNMMRQLQSVQLATPCATTSVAREQTPEATTPASRERTPAEFQTPEGMAIAMEIDNPTTTLVERYQLEWQRADLDSSRKELAATRQEKERLEDREKEAADRQVQELATQLEHAQFQLEKVWAKADLKTAFADLDTVQAQLDEEHERNSKLQAQVQDLEKEIRSMRRQALLRPRCTSRTDILRRSVGEFTGVTPGAAESSLA